MVMGDGLTVPTEDDARIPGKGVRLTNHGRWMGRPRGPERVPLTVRILAAQDKRLTAEVELQGLSPQYIVERALTEYFDRLDRLRGRAR
jgi:hypothetical protein